MLICFKTAVQDIVGFDFVVEGADTIAHIIDRYAIFEDLYLRHTSESTEKLKQALVILYASVLRYLAMAKVYVEQYSPSQSTQSITEDKC